MKDVRCTENNARQQFSYFINNQNAGREINMVYGFCLYDKRENLKTSGYNPSKFKDNFDENYGIILALLKMTEKIKVINFSDEEIEGYEIFIKSHRFFEPMDKNIMMKRRLEQILREQAIIAGVSNWECYFSDVSEDILKEYILEKIYTDKKRLNKFLNRFNLKRDFADEMLSNGYRIEGLKFAKYIIDNNKINYQDMDKVKDFLSILYNIKIAEIAKNNWNEILEFIQVRHKIIHNRNEIKTSSRYDEVIQKYTKEKIEKIINNMKQIIDKTDEILFTDYIST
ncbi:MAG: hypothetical protein WA130_00150 [Candidatus Methanoperedens sp.]